MSPSNGPTTPFTHTKLPKNLEGPLCIVTLLLKPNSGEEGKISCEINDKTLTEANKKYKYKAISHSWGHLADRPKRDILANSQSFIVPENVWHLFDRLRGALKWICGSMCSVSIRAIWRKGPSRSE